MWRWLSAGLLMWAVQPLAPAQLVFGPGTEASGQQLDTIVAVVNDDVITRRELEAAIAIVTSQLQQRGTPLPPREALERQILERLILTQLQQRAAESNGVVVDDQTLNETIEDLARRNNLSLSQLRATLERDGISFSEFREDIRKELLANRLRQRVVDSRIQISEQEVDDAINVPSQTSAEEYLVAQILIGLPDGATPEQIEQARSKVEQVLEQLRQGADFASVAAATSDGRQALEGGNLGWRSPEQIPSLFVETVLRLQPGQVSEPIRSPSGFHLVKLLDTRGSGQQALVAQTRARHILLTTNEQTNDDELFETLRSLRQRIRNGADFAALAGVHSQDSRTAENGGDLGWLNPGQLGPEFEQELSQLQPGEVSEPFQTRFGWHLVQVLERRQREGSSSDLQRAQARESLFRRRAEEEWELWLRRLRDEAYVELRL